MTEPRKEHTPYVVCGVTAQGFWRNFGADCLVQPTPEARQEALEIERFLTDATSLTNRNRPPVMLLAAHKEEVRPSNRKQWKLFSSEIPAEHLIPITEAVSLTSPELTLLTLGKDLYYGASDDRATARERELLALRTCMQLCGKQHPVSGSTKPLTNAAEIGMLLESVSYVRGVPLLRKMLPYIEDGARDDYDIWLYQLFCMPRRYGGLGIPRAQLGHAACTWKPHEAKEQALRVDLFWPGPNIGLSIAGCDHPFTRSVGSGRTWLDVKTEEGTTVVLATSSSLLSPRTIFELGCHVARHLRYVSLRSRMVYADRMRALLRTCPFRSDYVRPYMGVPLSHEDPLTPPGWEDILSALR